MNFRCKSRCRRGRRISTPAAAVQVIRAASPQGLFWRSSSDCGVADPTYVPDPKANPQSLGNLDSESHHVAIFGLTQPILVQSRSSGAAKGYYGMSPNRMPGTAMLRYAAAARAVVWRRLKYAKRSAGTATNAPKPSTL